MDEDCTSHEVEYKQTTVYITNGLIDSWLEGAQCPSGDNDWLPAKCFQFQREQAVIEIEIAAKKFSLNVINCLEVK